MSKLVTLKEMAAMDFQPWVHAEDEWKPPSNDEWCAGATKALVPIRMAWLTMYKSKVEIEDFLQKLEGSPGEEMLQSIAGAAEYFKTIADILAAAETRLLCAAASIDRKAKRRRKA